MSLTRASITRKGARSWRMEACTPAWQPARALGRRRWRSEANLADRNVGGLCSYCTRFSRHGVRCNNCVRTTAATRQNGKQNTDAAAIVTPPNTMSSPPATQTHSSSISSALHRRTGRKSSNRCQCRRCVCRCSRTCASRKIGKVEGGRAVGGMEKLHGLQGGMVCAHCAIDGGVSCRSINMS